MAADFWTMVDVPTLADRAGRFEIISAAADRLKAKGATFHRASHPLGMPNRVYVEGWIRPPDDQGPCDHDKFDPVRQI